MAHFFEVCSIRLIFNPIFNPQASLKPDSEFRSLLSTPNVDPEARFGGFACTDSMQTAMKLRAYDLGI